jgi:cation:H+ antiporter
LVVWLEFLALALVIGFSGYRLSVYGDILAEKRGWGRVWLGTALMAGVTSLPELATGVSAVAAASAPDLALGDVLGACVFNLMLISALDLLYVVRARASVFEFTSPGLIISGAFGVVLLGTVSLSLLMRGLWGVPAVGRLSLATILLALFYVLAVRGVFQYEASAAGEKPYAELYGDIPEGVALRGYVRHAAVVVAAGSYLPFVGKAIAAQQGWGTSLVGTLFMAVATTLPELVVTLGAVRLGAIDLAVGNIFGSNLFNMLILFFDDLAYSSGPLLARASEVHATTATIAMVMTGLAVAGIVIRPKRARLPFLGWITLAILLLFVLNVAVLVRVDALGR